MRESENSSTFIWWFGSYHLIFGGSNRNNPTKMNATFHINSKTASAIENVFGKFVLVGTPKTFEAHGEIRTAYTMRKPKGTKCSTFIQFSNGVII